MLKDKIKNAKDIAAAGSSRLTAKTLEAKRKVSERVGDAAADRESSSYILSLDIGTEFVKALIAKAEGDNIRILGAARGRQNLADMQSGAIANIQGVAATCERVLSRAEQQAKVEANSCVMGIAGELVKGSTTTVKFKRSDPDKEISYQEMEYVLDRVRQKAREKALTQLRWELANEDVDIRLVNSAVVAIHIDSYKVTNPISFKGGEISCTLYTAFAPLVHLAALEKVAGELNLDLLAVAAEPFAATRSVIGNDENNSLDAIVVDVGGGTTDIAVVREGGVEGTQMFGIGGRSFTKSIAADFDLSFLEAEKLKLALGSDKIAKSKSKRIEASLNKTLDVWLGGIELALDEFKELDHLPSRILICGGGASLDMLVEALNETDWADSLPFSRKPSVHRIEPSEVVHIVDETGIIKDHTFVTTMGLLRVGHDAMDGSEDEKPKMSSIRDRVNKALRI